MRTHKTLIFMWLITAILFAWMGCTDPVSNGIPDDDDTTYTVNFSVDSNGSLMGDVSQTVIYGDDCTPVTATAANPGYKFNGWSGDFTSNVNPLTVTNVTSNMNITANFVDTTDTIIIVEETEFYITGTVLNNAGDPIKGAVAALKINGFFAVSDVNGEYLIRGKVSKRGGAEIKDTVIVKMASPTQPDDTSEIEMIPVTSGIIMVLPESYIVQREIRGYLLDEDKAKVGRIEAYVYDMAVPDYIKTIDLWHDEVNDAFSSFAYFSSETMKVYTLYVMIYDTDDHFISRSPNFQFPDNAGNIIFKDPFSVVNAMPEVKVTDSVTSYNGKAKLYVTVTDSFALDSMINTIVKCEIDVGNTGTFKDIDSFPKVLPIDTLSKCRNTEGMIDSIVIDIDANTMIVVKVTDNDSNTVIDSIEVNVTNAIMELQYGVYWKDSFDDMISQHPDDTGIWDNDEWLPINETEQHNCAMVNDSLIFFSYPKLSPKLSVIKSEWGFTGNQSNVALIEGETQETFMIPDIKDSTDFEWITQSNPNYKKELKYEGKMYYGKQAWIAHKITTEIGESVTEFFPIVIYFEI